jgi:hypothetical protein
VIQEYKSCASMRAKQKSQNGDATANVLRVRKQSRWCEPIMDMGMQHVSKMVECYANACMVLPEHCNVGIDHHHSSSGTVWPSSDNVERLMHEAVQAPLSRHSGICPGCEHHY